MLTPAAAHAGGYVAVGIGDPPRLNGGVSGSFDRADDGHTGRIAIGQRLGIVALEADWLGAGMDRPRSGERWSSDTLGASLKLIAPILWRVELFGRGGVGRTWLSGGSDGTRYAGNGTVLGGGLQLDLGVPYLLDAALWAEYARHSVELHDRAKVMEPVDGSFDTLLIGLSLGF